MLVSADGPARSGRRLLCGALLIGIVIACSLEGVPLPRPARQPGPEQEIGVPKGVRPGSTLSGEPPGPPQPASHLWFILLGVLVVGSCLLGWVLWRLRRERARRESASPGAETAGGVLASTVVDARAVRRGIARSSAALTAVDRDPADALVQAWVALERAAADAGVPRGPADTPTEFTVRLLSRVDTDRTAATLLLGLYLRARFGQGAVGPDDVSRAEGALSELNRTWRVEESVERA